MTYEKMVEVLKELNANLSQEQIMALNLSALSMEYDGFRKGFITASVIAGSAFAIHQIQKVIKKAIDKKVMEQTETEAAC